MSIHNLAVNTQLAYVQQITALARHFDCSPEALGPEQVRAYQVHLIEERKLALELTVRFVAQEPMIFMAGRGARGRRLNGPNRFDRQLHGTEIGFV